MSTLQAEVYEAFRAIDVPDKALKAAVALSAAFDGIEDATAKGFNKRDADIEAIRKEVTGINLRLTTMVGEMTLIKGMLGTTLAAVVTVLFRVFSH